MKLITNINGEYLRTVYETLPEGTVSEIKMAIAYASDSPPLLEWGWRNNIKLSFWCRYDYSVPVSTAILKKFLDRKSFLYNCYLVTDFFHAKVIWFVGYGAYIGSANLTDRAWNTNIEAGIFLTESELVKHGVDLDEFFTTVNEKSTELNEQAYEYLLSREQIINQRYKKEQEEEKQFKEKSPVKYLLPEAIVTKRQASDRAKDSFLARWNDVTGILEKITAQAGNSDNYPTWIPKDTSPGIVSDQFLHDFYYRSVRNPDNKNTYKVDEFYDKNKDRQPEAFKEALKDWKNLKEANSGEDYFVNFRAPILKKYLNKEKLKTLTEEEFVELCRSFHSFWEVARYIEQDEIGLNVEFSSTDEKAPLLAKKFYHDRTKDGLSILEVLYYVIYGGSTDQTVHRFWEARTDSRYLIPHFGKSCLGELVGWAMPEKFHPINGRTLKALKSLGHDVDLHL